MLHQVWNLSSEWYINDFDNNYLIISCVRDNSWNSLKINSLNEINLEDMEILGNFVIEKFINKI